MPIYEYKCGKCGKVCERLRPMAKMEESLACECGGTAEHVISEVSRFQRGSGWHARMDGAPKPGRA